MQPEKNRIQNAQKDYNLKAQKRANGIQKCNHQIKSSVEKVEDKVMEISQNKSKGQRHEKIKIKRQRTNPGSP